jgi:hypothetical protein
MRVFDSESGELSTEEQCHRGTVELKATPHTRELRALYEKLPDSAGKVKKKAHAQYLQFEQMAREQNAARNTEPVGWPINRRAPKRDRAGEWPVAVQCSVNEIRIDEIGGDTFYLDCLVFFEWQYTNRRHHFLLLETLGAIDVEEAIVRRVEKNNKVTVKIHYRGHFAQRFDFSRFPWDTQTVQLSVKCLDHEVDFVQGEELPLARTGWMDDVSEELAVMDARAIGSKAKTKIQGGVHWRVGHPKIFCGMCKRRDEDQHATLPVLVFEFHTSRRLAVAGIWVVISNICAVMVTLSSVYHPDWVHAEGSAATLWEVYMSGERKQRDLEYAFHKFLPWFWCIIVSLLIMSCGRRLLRWSEGSFFLLWEALISCSDPGGDIGLSPPSPLSPTSPRSAQGHNKSAGCVAATEQFDLTVLRRALLMYPCLLPPVAAGAHCVLANETRRTFEKYLAVCWVVLHAMAVALWFAKVPPTRVGPSQRGGFVNLQPLPAMGAPGSRKQVEGGEEGGKDLDPLQW